MKVILTTTDDGRLCLESPYSKMFVEGLKAAIPWGGRAWEPTSKRWLISALYEEELRAFCGEQQVDIQDARAARPLSQTSVPDMPDDLRQAFDTLSVQYTGPLLVCEASWKALSKVYHPDNQDYGDAEKSLALNGAIATIRKYLAPRDDDCYDDTIPF